MHNPQRRINCIHFDPNGCGRCNHSTGKSFIGRLPCILVTADSRIGSCRVQVEYAKPVAPQPPPSKR